MQSVSRSHGTTVSLIPAGIQSVTFFPWLSQVLPCQRPPKALLPSPTAATGTIAADSQLFFTDCPQQKNHPPTPTGYTLQEYREDS